MSVSSSLDFYKKQHTEQTATAGVIEQSLNPFEIEIYQMCCSTTCIQSPLQGSENKENQ